MGTSIVTGGAGFLGSHLVDKLTSGGEAVVVLDNLATGHLGNLAGAIASGRATFIYTDIAVGTDALRDIIRSGGVENVERIYHFVPRPPPAEDPLVHAEAMRALIDIAIEKGARLVVVSDEFSGPAEAVDEAAVGAAVRDRELDARIVRVFHCYGPRADTGDADIAAMFEATRQRRPMPIEGSGKQVRPMTYVADAIDGLLTVALREDAPLATDIVSTDEPSALEIARTLARGVGRDFAFEYVTGHPEPQHPLAGRNDRVALGVPAGTSLEAGLRKTYDWFTKESHQYV